jgi:DMSO/TMAO reductase YedYZ molybdopterin-dependent catalytic subunit
MFNWLTQIISGRPESASSQENPTEVREFMANTGNPRVPAGQYLTAKFPVLTFGSTPRIDMATWQFNVSGLVEEELTWSWDEFKAMSPTALTADFHCVTQWSQLDNAWEGVSIQDIMKRIKPLPSAGYVMLHCYGGYTTNLSLADLVQDDVLFAYKQEGKDLAPDHGGPLRLIVPKLYAWKSAKWVNGMEFMEHDKPGFWEQRGYHMVGDPWKEQRYS